jgi:hypothetical protein
MYAQFTQRESNFKLVALGLLVILSLMLSAQTSAATVPQTVDDSAPVILEDGAPF